MKELLIPAGLSLLDMDPAVLGAVTTRTAPCKNGPHSLQRLQLTGNVSAADVCLCLHC